MSAITAKQKRYLEAMCLVHPETYSAHVTVTLDQLTVNEAREAIGKIVADIDSRAGYRPCSKRAIISDALFHRGMDQTLTQNDLKVWINEGKLKFQNNQDGRRVDMEPEEQYVVLERTIKDVAERMGGGGNDEKKEEKKDDSPMDAQGYLKVIHKIRRWCRKRAADGQPIDEISMRPTVYGKKMAAVGIPYEAMLFALTMHWPKALRQEQGIEEYDPSTFGERIPGKHKVMPYVMALAEARVPIALVGPKGSGKSTIGTQLAEILGLNFGYIPMTAGATPSWLTGAFTLDGYKTRPFVEIYEKGGVFVLEEMDASDPNMLLLVNNAIANDSFFNPVTGEEIRKHPDFIPIACMNTHGLGANRQYTGRERLDAATLDRYNMGRVKVDIDEKLEKELFFS